MLQLLRTVGITTTSAFVGLQVYPLWVPIGQGAGELLLGIEIPPDLGFSQRFFIKGGHVVKTDTLPVF